MILPNGMEVNIRFKGFRIYGRITFNMNAVYVKNIVLKRWSFIFLPPA